MPEQDPENKTVTVGKVSWDELCFPSLLTFPLLFSVSCHKHCFSLLKSRGTFKLRSWRNTAHVSVWLDNKAVSNISLLNESLGCFIWLCMMPRVEPKWILVCFRPKSTFLSLNRFPQCFGDSFTLGRCEDKCPRSVMSSMVSKLELVFKTVERHFDSWSGSVNVNLEERKSLPHC